MKRFSILVMLALSPGCHTYMDFSRASGGTSGGACVPGSTIDCYTGPEGSAGVGSCRAGTQVCNEDGSGYGECTNEITPHPENCATPIDDDCDGIAPGCTGAVLWAKTLGDASSQSASTVAVDSADNIILGGSFAGTLNFGGATLAAVSLHDRFVAKLDPNGDHIWSTRFGSNASVAGITLTVDSSDNVIVAGTFYESSDFGCGTIEAVEGHDAFVAKLDPGGTCIWSAPFGGNGSELATSVAVDAQDHIIVAGRFSGTISFANTTLTSSGYENAFVAKLDSSGMPVWGRRFGDSGSAFALDVDADAVGRLVVTGAFTGSVDFGGGPLVNNQADDVFLAKLNDDGAHIWSMRYGDGEQQMARALCITKEDHIILAGLFEGAIDFGGQPFSSLGMTDMFVTRIEQPGSSV